MALSYMSTKEHYIIFSIATGSLSWNTDHSDPDGTKPAIQGCTWSSKGRLERAVEVLEGEKLGHFKRTRSIGRMLEDAATTDNDAAVFLASCMVLWCLSGEIWIADPRHVVQVGAWDPSRIIVTDCLDHTEADERFRPHKRLVERAGCTIMTDVNIFDVGPSNLRTFIRNRFGINTRTDTVLTITHGFHYAYGRGHVGEKAILSANMTANLALECLYSQFPNGVHVFTYTHDRPTHHKGGPPVTLCGYLRLTEFGDISNKVARTRLELDGAPGVRIVHAGALPEGVFEKNLLDMHKLVRSAMMGRIPIIQMACYDFHTAGCLATQSSVPKEVPLMAADAESALSGTALTDYKHVRRPTQPMKSVACVSPELATSITEAYDTLVRKSTNSKGEIDLARIACRIQHVCSMFQSRDPPLPDNYSHSEYRRVQVYSFLDQVMSSVGNALDGRATAQTGKLFVYTGTYTPSSRSTAASANVTAGDLLVLCACGRMAGDSQRCFMSNITKKIEYLRGQCIALEESDTLEISLDAESVAGGLNAVSEATRALATRQKSYIAPDYFRERWNHPGGEPMVMTGRDHKVLYCSRCQETMKLAPYTQRYFDKSPDDFGVCFNIWRCDHAWTTYCNNIDKIPTNLSRLMSQNPMVDQSCLVLLASLPRITQLGVLTLGDFETAQNSPTSLVMARISKVNRMIFGDIHPAKAFMDEDRLRNYM